MSFDKTLLPDAAGYFESQDLPLKGRGEWATIACRFHGGSDSLRVNRAFGYWACMACHVKGGDVLSYHMQAHDMDFVSAAKALGAWQGDGKQNAPQRPTALSPRQALKVLEFEATFIAVAAANMAHGVQLKDVDSARLLLASHLTTKIYQDIS